MPFTSFDCLIVGGGVIGLSAAWELSTRGLRCGIIDAAEIGRGCSWAGAGVFPAANFQTALDPIDQLRGLSHKYHPSWAKRLFETTGIDSGFRECGGIYLARSFGEAASLNGQASYWHELGIAANQLSTEELVARQPAIDPNTAGPNTAGPNTAGPNTAQVKTAWWVPDESQLCPPDHLRALIVACKLNDVQFFERTKLNELVVVDGRLKGLRTDRVISAGQVVLACGAWASKFHEPTGRLSDVFPVRGQVVLYQAKPKLLTTIITEGNRYLVPRDNGTIYVGSNEEEVGWQEGTTEAVIDSLKSWAETLVPALKQADIVKTWSGLRPGSFDGFPYIGESADVKNLYFATGHYRSGLHLSCGTAVVLADQMLGTKPPMSLSAFAVSR